MDQMYQHARGFWLFHPVPWCKVNICLSAFWRLAFFFFFFYNVQCGRKISKINLTQQHEWMNGQHSAHHDDHVYRRSDTAQLCYERVRSDYSSSSTVDIGWQLRAMNSALPSFQTCQSTEPVTCLVYGNSSNLLTSLELEFFLSSFPALGASKYWFGCTKVQDWFDWVGLPF